MKSLSCSPRACRPRAMHTACPLFSGAGLKALGQCSSVTHCLVAPAGAPNRPHTQSKDCPAPSSHRSAKEQPKRWGTGRGEERSYLNLPRGANSTLGLHLGARCSR